jgi:pyridoxal phosphate enzyme (YggS family)
VHTVDREKIARRLSEQRPQAMPPLDVLVQVNVSGEASKSGVAPREVAGLAKAVAALPRLRLRGLMAVPEPTGDEHLQRARFREVRELFESLRSAGLALDTLSMGMTADMQAAIAEGSTMVRIGTAIFGVRQKVKDAA